MNERSALLKEEREKMSPDIVKGICDGLGITIRQLSHGYGKANNYFGSAEITKRGGLRPPESRYVREMWKKNPVPAPMDVELNVLKIRGRMCNTSLTDLARLIGRSDGYFYIVKRTASGRIPLTSGEVIMIAERLGCSWDDLEIEPKPKNEVSDEWGTLDDVPPEWDNGMSEEVPIVVKDREQISLLSSFTDEELIAEIARRMKR